MTTKSDKRWRATTRPHGGKGSASRPRDYQKYSDNWENIFGKNTTEDLGDQDQGTENFGQEKI